MRLLLAVNLLSAMLLSSCSWLARVERDLVSDDKATSKKKREYVPKQQYDELLARYQQLEKERQTGTPTTSLVDDLQQAPLVSEVKESAPQTNVETIDVFSNEKKTNSPVTPSASPASNFNKNLKNDWGASLELYQRALSLMPNDQAEALKIFQHLELHGPLSFQARSKYQIGKMFFEQQEYDLALQSFEAIVQKHAHSGIVLESLKKLVECSDKLGLKEKKDRYQSLVHDVFGLQAGNG